MIAERKRGTAGVAGFKASKDLHPKVVAGLRFLMASLVLEACTPITRGNDSTQTFPPESPTTEIIPPTSVFTNFGPEATPPVSAPVYPSSLSVQEILSFRDGGGALPPGFTTDAYISSFVETRRAWARESGVNVDDPSSEDYVTMDIVTWGQDDSFRWDVVPKNASGEIAGWLQIADETIETGWRFAESPNRDTHLDPENDDLRYGLPESLSPNNQFETILVNGEYKVLVELDSSGAPVRWLDTVSQEMRIVEGSEQVQNLYQLEDGTSMERAEGHQLNEVFPGSEVYLSERGDVVIINNQQDVQLAGQRIETRYGSYTVLMSDELYTRIITAILEDVDLDESSILESYPADWVSNPTYRQEILDALDDLKRLRGYIQNFSGYPNLSGSPYQEELVRIMSTLIALREGSINLGGVDLASYQPAPRDFLVVEMTPGNGYKMAQMLPEGSINPEIQTIYTQGDTGFPLTRLRNGVYVSGFFGGNTPGRALNYPDTVFYDFYMDYYVQYPLRFLLRDAGRTQGVDVLYGADAFFNGPFFPLFQREEIYGHLSAFTERSPFQPPYSLEQNLIQRDWQNLGVEDLIEVDFGKFP